MLTDGMIDGFLTGGYLPNVKAITITKPNGTVITGLTARREDAEDKLLASVGLTRETESCVFFIPIAQTGFQWPFPFWKITATGWDGAEWVIFSVGNGPQQRGAACLCTKKPLG